VNTGRPEIDNTDADYIIGSDECGYGSWAGPLVVCAALVPLNWPLAGVVKDSKAFTGTKAEEKRAVVASKIIDKCLWVIKTVHVPEIDSFGVYKALIGAHTLAIKELIAKHKETGAVGKILTIVDGTLPIPDAISLPKADGLVPAVSAASIIGKVARDAWMTKIATKYPGYGFESNKGYGSAQHEEGIAKLGVCDIHRKSYAPIKEAMQRAEAAKTEVYVSVPDDLFED
jgi:ribonuclease HII